MSSNAEKQRGKGDAEKQGGLYQKTELRIWRTGGGDIDYLIYIFVKSIDGFLRKVLMPLSKPRIS